jgi:hypothetical protein
MARPSSELQLCLKAGLRLIYKSNKFKMKTTRLLSMLFVGVSVLGCSDDDNNKVEQPVKPFVNPDVAEVYKGTQSPGDVWSWSLDNEQKHMIASWDYGTFDDTSDDLEIEGTFEKLPSGFLKVTITKVTPVSNEILTDGSAWFYALEIPGMAMIVKPEGSIKGDLIAMIPEGDCPTIEGKYNYVISAPGDRSSYNPITDEAFGTIDMTATGSGFSISGYKFSLDCIDGACSESGVINGLPTATCVGGGEIKVSSSGKTVAEGQFTNAGAMMMDFGYGKGGVFALKATEAATKGSLADNSYSGIAYMPKNNNDQTVAVKLQFFNNGLDNMIGAGNPYSDIENNLVDTEEGATVLVENVVNGRVYGSMNFDNLQGGSQMAGALLVNGDNQILILSSYEEESQNPFILILAKQN